MGLWTRILAHGNEPSSTRIGRIETRSDRQEWMKANLDVSAFRNGDAIREAKTNEEWEAAFDAGQPAWCNYENSEGHGERFGKLYNWHAVNDRRGLAPAGWHVPTHAEVTAFAGRLGIEAGKSLKSTSGWANDGNGKDTAGFTALPGGVRGSEAVFKWMGNRATWWTATEATANAAWQFDVSAFNTRIDINMSHKLDGFSVRCIKD